MHKNLCCVLREAVIDPRGVQCGEPVLGMDREAGYGASGQLKLEIPI